MKIEIKPLPAGLHFIATPIGAARDITLRALDILASADVLAAEDTRSLRRLMDIHGVALNGRSIVAYHDHNGKAQRPRLLRAMAEGKSVAYASEAGTPLVADPGFSLGLEARNAGYFVTTAPGPSAALAALTVSGLASDRFLFVGFLPPASKARKAALEEIGRTPATLILYESPKRIHRILDDMREVWGDSRQVAICRELTKKFEEVTTGTLEDVTAAYGGRTVKGEIVIVVARAEAIEADPADIETALRHRLAEMSLKDAAAEVAQQFDQPRRQIYQLGLSLEKDE